MRRLFPWLMMLTIVMGACTGKIPSSVIQPTQMEEILYDYHLSLAIASRLPSTDNYKRQLFRDYVLEKHGVSSAKFDSSWVWYSRNSSHILAIYEHLQERFKAEQESFDYRLSLRVKDVANLSGDTVDVWPMHELILLRDTPIFNMVSFSLKSDTAFHERDILTYSAHFLPITQPMPQMMMALSLVYENDSVVSQQDSVCEPGLHTLTIKPDSAFSLKSVNGYITFKNMEVNKREVLLNNLSLIRIHRLASDTLVSNTPVDSLMTDSIMTDSLRTDSIPVK